MNRELKFRRAHYNLNGDFLCFTYWGKIDDGFMSPSIVSGTISVKDEQFTGLKDRDGKEVYEGDILDCKDRVCAVIWHNEAGQFDSVFLYYKGKLSSTGITNQEWKYRAKVIRNIHTK